MDLLKGDQPGKARREYIQKILTAYSHPACPPGAFNKTAAAKSQAVDVPGLLEPEVQPAKNVLAEPLTPRELQVLRLIADGDSNQAIAEKLVITVSAVKKHTGNIYGKLAVNSRTQAVSRARQFGLLGKTS